MELWKSQNGDNSRGKESTHTPLVSQASPNFQASFYHLLASLSFDYWHNRIIELDVVVGRLYHYSYV